MQCHILCTTRQHLISCLQKMFHGLAPVMSSFGMKMLKKMGWQEGQPLGKKGEGHVEPIALDVKVDRSGKWLDLDQ